MDCLQDRNPHFLRLCEENMYSYESSNYVRCSFFSEVVQQCRHNSYIWIIWRTLTGCGWWPYYFCLWISILWSTFYDLSRFSEPLYQRLLPAPGTWCMKSRELLLFLAVPTLTPVTPARTSSDPVFAQRVNSVCCFPLSEFTWPLCKSCFHRFLGSVLNDQTDGFHCVNISKCPCKFAGRSYVSGDKRSTNCQTWWGGRKKKDFLEKVLFFLKSHLWISRLSVCQAGGWHCSENSCPPRCLLEGQFVTTFDGKQYAVPGKCAYVASQVIVDSTWLKINMLKPVWLLTAVFSF